MAESAQSIIIDRFAESLSDLLECYTGHEPKLSPTDVFPAESLLELDQQTILTASIGFGADQVRGSVVLFAEKETAARVGSCGSEISICDWFGELSNQLIGRFKNKITEYGVLLNMGLPVTLSGTAISMHHDMKNEQSWEVDSSAGRLIVLLTVNVEDGLCWEPCPSSEAAEEGSLCLF